MQTEILSFKIMAVIILMPTIMAGRDYNEHLPGFVTSQTLKFTETPPPGTCNKGGEAMLHWFREEEELGVHEKKSIYMIRAMLAQIMRDPLH